MAGGVVAIPYSEDLLLALREEPETFEREARLLLAVKLYELGKLCNKQRPVAHLVVTESGSAGAPYALHRELCAAHDVCHTSLTITELGKLSTGMAAQLAGMTRVAFMLELAQYGLSPLGVDANELAEDVAHA